MRPGRSSLGTGESWEPPGWAWLRSRLSSLAAGQRRRSAPITVVDLNALAAYCQAYAHWRTAEEVLTRMRERDPLTSGIMLKTRNGNPIPNPLLVAANKAASDMIRYASEFGLTPAARSRIAAAHVEVGKPKFAGLLAG
jgi:P27 family predicted phage terminase small subunit